MLSVVESVQPMKICPLFRLVVRSWLSHKTRHHAKTVLYGTGEKFNPMPLGVDITAPAEELFTHNVSSPAPLYHKTLIHPFHCPQSLTRPTYQSRPAASSSPVVYSQCLHRNPTQDDRPRKAGQVSPTITSSTAEPQTAATVSRPAAFRVRAPDAEDETVSAHVPERGDAAALVLDE